MPPAFTLPPTQKPVVARPVAMTYDFAVPVLMYHRICDLTPREARSPLMRSLTVSPAHFEQQIRYLVENGFTFLLARDVEAAVREHRSLPEKAVVLTMDDGYKDNFDHAFPILREYGVPATMFLVSATVNTEGHLSWDDVLVMRREQVGYGSHTVHHYDLTLLPAGQVDYELCASRRTIESHLGERITDIAYPSGKVNALVEERTRADGYLAGWKKGGGPVQPENDLYLLPRVRVCGGTTMAEFKRIVWSGVYVIRERQRARHNAQQGTTA